MTDEEMAENYIKNNNLEWELECHRTSPIGEVKQAFLAGLKAGSQLDKVWHDYDAGEDCYEDTHEGKWVKREDIKPKWHKVADGDLPKEEDLEMQVLCFTYDGYQLLSLFSDPKPIFKGYGVIAWCEIPKYTEE